MEDFAFSCGLFDSNQQTDLWVSGKLLVFRLQPFCPLWCVCVCVCVCARVSSCHLEFVLSCSNLISKLQRKFAIRQISKKTNFHIIWRFTSFWRLFNFCENMKILEAEKSGLIDTLCQSVSTLITDLSLYSFWYILILMSFINLWSFLKARRNMRIKVQFCNKPRCKYFCQVLCNLTKVYMKSHSYINGKMYIRDS